MVILSLDTTTRAGSCAVWHGDGDVDERVGNPEFTHAHRLPTDLATLLASHALRLPDVTRYAVASGPGSFTGLRVGISTMQALALVHDRLIVPISSLEAMAYCAAREEAAHAGTCVGAWMEAYRGEVFGALYRVRSAPTAETGGLAVLETIVEPDVGTPEAMADAWLAHIDARAQTAGVAAPSLIVMGDAVLAQRETLVARFPDARLREAAPIAGMIARLAAREPERGVRPHAVVPLYLRRPLAELARERVRQQRDAVHHQQQR